jgi:hypothetical protein
MMSLGDVLQIVDPCLGEIEIAEGGAFRRP